MLLSTLNGHHPEKLKVFDDLLEQATKLKNQDIPFVLATVVACQPPTSAKPGARAIIRADGSFYGWVGGSCAQPLVVQQSLRVLQGGRAQVIVLTPHPEDVDFRLEGVVPVPMTCQSEGTLAIYLEPFLPRPQLLVIGHSPMARSLVALGHSIGFRVSAGDPAASNELFPDADMLVSDLAAMGESLGPRSYVVVATMGHYDEEALEEVLKGEASYIGLVASPRRGRAVIQYLKGKGAPFEALERVKYPAGLDIGAETPEEIALSILTEIVQRMRSQGGGIMLDSAVQPVSLEAVDPICQMTVSIADARYASTHHGQTFYFCCLRCQETFDREPDRYALPPAQ
ncbi:MAG TPA: XdhC family protein [Dehalococcoidia bacterium]|nr:XdhC family protein [Dehalococcoidia bacterium]